MTPRYCHSRNFRCPISYCHGSFNIHSWACMQHNSQQKSNLSEGAIKCVDTMKFVIDILIFGARSRANDSQLVWIWSIIPRPALIPILHVSIRQVAGHWLSYRQISRLRHLQSIDRRQTREDACKTGQSTMKLAKHKIENIRLQCLLVIINTSD